MILEVLNHQKGVRFMTFQLKLNQEMYGEQF